jgi:hypothetical protein
MSVDHSSYRHVFSGGVVDVWYAAGVEVCASGNQASVTIDTIRIIPFIGTGTNRKIDRLGAAIAGNAGAGNFRVAIYDNTGINFLYPNNLIIDSGNLPTTALGVIAANVNVTLTAGQLYWAAHITSRASVFRCVNVDQLLNILGISPTLPNDFNLGLRYPTPFAAFPNPFFPPATPGMSILSTVPIPMMAFRFAP